MLNLLHGAYIHTHLKALQEVPITPQGKRSDRWTGIQHGELVNCVLDAFDKEGFIPSNPRWYLSPNQAALIGGFELTNRTATEDVPVELSGVPHLTHSSFGLVHSNDSKSALRFVIGGRVMVCQNGLVTGSFLLHRKHTSGLNLKEWTRNGVQDALAYSQNQAKSLQRLTGVFVTPLRHDRGLLMLGRQGIIPWRLLGGLDADWRNSASSSEHPFRERTAWSWLNHATDVIKKIPIPQQYSTLRRAYSTAQLLGN